MGTEAEQLMKGFGKMVRALLQRLRIKDPNSVVGRYGWTLLMQATNCELYELAEDFVKKEMLALGVDVIFALPSDGDRVLHVMSDMVGLLADNKKTSLNVMKIVQTAIERCPLIILEYKKVLKTYCLALYTFF
ncbi:unnamed protein product [Peronospora destructor]|uniref:Uncharacterized protein n=1 Tax=Peronospora destructor TaxID=86335 RepID=A0AAV0UX70_9STRA|nr:unnamed protein product [Peronospora destructor]